MSPTYAACCCVVDSDCLDPCDCDLRAADEQVSLVFNFFGSDTSDYSGNADYVPCPNNPTEGCYVSESLQFERRLNCYLRATIDLSTINEQTCTAIPTIIEDYNGKTFYSRKYSQTTTGDCLPIGLNDCYEEYQSCYQTNEFESEFNLEYSSPFVVARLEKYSDCSNDFPTNIRCQCLESSINEDQCFIRLTGGFNITSQDIEEHGPPSIFRSTESAGCASDNTDEPLDDCEAVVFSEVRENLGSQTISNFYIYYKPLLFEVLYAIERDADGKCAFVKVAERIGRAKYDRKSTGYNMCPYTIETSVDLSNSENIDMAFCQETFTNEITAVHTRDFCGMLSGAKFIGDYSYETPCGTFGTGSQTVINYNYESRLSQSGYVGFA